MQTRPLSVNSGLLWLQTDLEPITGLKSKVFVAAQSRLDWGDKVITQNHPTHPPTPPTTNSPVSDLSNTTKLTLLESLLREVTAIVQLPNIKLSTVV